MCAGEPWSHDQGGVAGKIVHCFDVVLLCFVGTCMCAISQFSFVRRGLEYVGQEERCIVGGANVQNRSGVVEQQGMSLFHKLCLSHSWYQGVCLH